MNGFLKRAIVFFLMICSVAIGSFAQSSINPKVQKYKIKNQILPFQIGDKKLDLIVSKTGAGTPKFVYFNPHDNENTAVEAATATIERFGGTLIKLDNEGKRLVTFSIKERKFTFDPNRIFTIKGIKETLKKNGETNIEAEREVGKFAQNLEKLLDAYRLIIAVHNNTDEEYSMKSYEDIEDLGKDVKFFNENPAFDTDDFFYATEKDIFQYLKEKNQNVVLQDNSKVTDDGSLSVYCGQNKIQYLNVESQHGHLEEQKKMLEIVQGLIRKINKNQSRSYLKNNSQRPLRRLGVLCG